MTAVAAPVRRARTGTSTRARSAPRRTSPPSASRTRARTASPARARVGVAVVVAIVFVLVSAVLFHVVLAQGQLQLDRLDGRIAAERQEYEQLRLQVSTLSSPQRIIEQAQGLGFVTPDEPPVYVEVAGAKVPEAGKAVRPPSTLGDWEDVKPQLGDTKP